MITILLALLDELDKEINKYAMRTTEWYGWHFPESISIIGDNLLFAKTVLRIGECHLLYQLHASFDHRNLYS